ncbi:hypothetical protein [Kitasatospora sp. NPDC093806]|uniref:hypothetical protein n=1 Tax=Kitasatospora sp. NPDC093806 TaxID=3155075 RepID=UPI00343A8ECC
MRGTTTEHDGPGPLERADEALSRRGFTTRGLRLRAAGVLLAIAAGASGVLLYNLTNAFGPDTVCGGAATADAVHDALGPGRISEDKSAGYSPTAVDPAGSCVATVRYGLFGTSERNISFKTVMDTGTGPRTPPTARLFSGGGTAGAVTGSGAWALLPEGCPTGLRTAVGLDGKKPDGDRSTELARLAVAYADRAAKARNCGTGALTGPKELSPAGAEQPVDPAKVCGLPGFAPVRNEAVRDELRQRSSGALAPVWSCELGRTWGDDVLVSFGITTDPRVMGPQPPGRGGQAYGRSTWFGRDTVVADCQGKPTYFHLESELVASTGRDKVFQDDKALWTQFLAAGGAAIGCEPIVP